MSITKEDVQEIVKNEIAKCKDEIFVEIFEELLNEFQNSPAPNQVLNYNIQKRIESKKEEISRKG